MPSTRLDDRGVVAVTGQEARAFLDRIVTCEVETLAAGGARYGALLAPQGKILTDFVMMPGAAAADGGETFLLDAPAANVADLAKRLTLYRLRAKLTVADRSAELAVVAGWGEASPPEGAEAQAADPRLAALGWRAIVPRDRAPAGDDGAAYDAHRIALGIPSGGQDFAFADAFPHEALMDQIGGVDFKKGCYVGQEVVSRMQHRGTARTRILPLIYDGAPPPPGTEVRAGEKVLGRTGTVSGSRGLATLRIDRVADALDAGEALLADGVPARIDAPDWIRFAVPGRAATDAA
ncbi:YgfZ/GcvT domain-containing protein [Enterovirga rhinocerotis]|uniref:Uncharacterized protein n=1 Tax=Enterovirga rhinocerotis TaxID=1339210 RepID=A0A4V3DYX5_9HYPH|nr:folate-binding protein YgfZ [Enterovirga rhinocerotis]TDR94319.1 hypothetical protein EV668_1604 [Enterovirga rhinocerotis]